MVIRMLRIIKVKQLQIEVDLHIVADILRIVEVDLQIVADILRIIRVDHRTGAGILRIITAEEAGMAAAAGGKG